MISHFEPQKKKKLNFIIITCFLLCSFYLYFGALNRVVRIRSPGPVFGVEDSEPSNSSPLSPPPSPSLGIEELVKVSEENRDGGDGEETDCDFFDGKWVWDETYPLYDSKACSFVEGGFRCSENGRPDLSYTKWRWQPHNCNLPRFDAKMMLEKLRNKRVVFVGDSVGRTQWESLLCMLSSAVHDKSSIYEVNGNPITKRQAFLGFRFRNYNCSIEYYKASFLVQEESAPVGAPEKVRRVLKLDQLMPVSDKWRGADLLLFNSGHWWISRKTVRRGVFFQEGDEIKMNMSVESAFERVMETLLKWVGREVNLSKSHVFFRSYAPHHFSGGDVNGGTCHKENQPNLRLPFSPGNWPHYKIASDVLSRDSRSFQKMSLLNITNLTAQRKDGHCSLYNHDLIPYYKRRKTPPRYRQDCLHWCLPGVPDTWNELLYAILDRKEPFGLSKSSSSS